IRKLHTASTSSLPSDTAALQALLREKEQDIIDRDMEIK
ncbi:hypothetical protein KIPB_014185, partial [Kipferlia bialata]